MSPTVIWSENDITIWSFPLDVPAELLSKYSSVLSTDEIARAQSFRTPELRTGAMVRRGVLRYLLADKLSISPSFIQFRVGKFGKPIIVDQAIHFSASSSGAFGLVAISSTWEIGVDIERHDSLAVNDSFDSFTKLEQGLLREAEEPEELFFRIWVRKEAYVKATGDGLSSPLSQIEVLPDLNDRCFVEKPLPVTIQDVQAPPRYSIAIGWRGDRQSSQREKVECHVE